MFYELRAYNSQTRWGWTTNPAVAEAAAAALNAGKEINLYHVHELTDEEAAERGYGDHRDDAMFGDDTAVTDFD